MKTPTVAILSGWALPCTALLGAVSMYFGAPFWYVAFQVVFGVWASTLSRVASQVVRGEGVEKKTRSLQRSRIAGLLQMGATTLLAVAAHYQWPRATPVVAMMTLGAVAVACIGREQRP